MFSENVAENASHIKTPGMLRPRNDNNSSMVLSISQW
jgi:hypothetical protein